MLRYAQVTLALLLHVSFSFVHAHPNPNQFYYDYDDVVPSESVTLDDNVIQSGSTILDDSKVQSRPPALNDNKRNTRHSIEDSNYYNSNEVIRYRRSGSKYGNFVDEDDKLDGPSGFMSFLFKDPAFSQFSKATLNFCRSLAHSFINDSSFDLKGISPNMDILHYVVNTLGKIIMPGGKFLDCFAGDVPPLKSTIRCKVPKCRNKILNMAKRFNKFITALSELSNFKGKNKHIDTLCCKHGQGEYIDSYSVDELRKLAAVLKEIEENRKIKPGNINLTNNKNLDFFEGYTQVGGSNPNSIHNYRDTSPKNVDYENSLKFVNDYEEFNTNNQNSCLENDNPTKRKSIYDQTNIADNKPKNTNKKGNVLQSETIKVHKNSYANIPDSKIQHRTTYPQNSNSRVPYARSYRSSYPTATYTNTDNTRDYLPSDLDNYYSNVPYSRDYESNCHRKPIPKIQDPRIRKPTYSDQFY